MSFAFKSNGKRNVSYSRIACWSRLLSNMPFDLNYLKVSVVKPNTQCGLVAFVVTGCSQLTHSGLNIYKKKCLLAWLQNFAFFNRLYMIERKTLPKYTCPSGRFTCLGLLGSGNVKPCLLLSALIVYVVWVVWISQHCVVYAYTTWSKDIDDFLMGNKVPLSYLNVSANIDVLIQMSRLYLSKGINGHQDLVWFADSLLTSKSY